MASDFAAAQVVASPVKSIHLSHADIKSLADKIAKAWRGKKIASVYGIPMGGLPVAIEVAARLRVGVLPTSMTVSQLLALEAAGDRILVVDDLIDSGATMRPFFDAGLRTDALIRKPHSDPALAPNATEMDAWIVFPWERTAGPEDAIVRLLEYIGDDPTREGVKETPRRVIKAFAEMTSGMHVDPASVLTTTFAESFDEPIFVRGIRFVSLCEHHLLPFTGTCVVGYQPSGRVVGLSKIPRLVEILSRRPQLQEQLTRQIADVLGESVGALGVGVAVRAQHSCMGCRGVRQPDAEMLTCVLRGSWTHDDERRRRLEDWA